VAKSGPAAHCHHKKRKAKNSSAGSTSTQSSRKKAHIEDTEDKEENSEPSLALVVSSSAPASKVKHVGSFYYICPILMINRSLTQETQYTSFTSTSTLILRDVQDSQVISTTSAIMAITIF